MKYTSLENRGRQTTPKCLSVNHSRPASERTRQYSDHSINEAPLIKPNPVLRRNNLNLLWLIWIVFASYFEFNIGEASSPLNRAAIKGDKVQLHCSTTENENGYWKYTKPSEKNQRRIYNGGKVVNGMTALFSVNDSVQGHFNLVFNASESTSGRFTCQPDLNSADQSAEVIVLDASPNCSMVEAPGFVTASCSIDFNGNWAPEIQWYNMKGRLETNETSIIQNSRVTSLLIVPYNDTGKFDNLTCTPTFAHEKKPRETTAMNVPILLKKCTLTMGSSSDDSSTQTTTDRPTDAVIPPSATNYIVAIVVCLGVAATIAVLGVFLYKRKLRTRRPINKDHSEVSMPMAKSSYKT